MSNSHTETVFVLPFLWEVQSLNSRYDSLSFLSIKLFDKKYILDQTGVIYVNVQEM